MAQDDDYKAPQNQIIQNYDQRKQQFFSRGHLTPNADFSLADQRSYTMVTTNVAPQWQLFNSKNWAEMERLRPSSPQKMNCYCYYREWKR